MAPSGAAAAGGVQLAARKGPVSLEAPHLRTACVGHSRKSRGPGRAGRRCERDDKDRGACGELPWFAA